MRGPEAAETRSLKRSAANAGQRLKPFARQAAASKSRDAAKKALAAKALGWLTRKGLAR